MGTGEGTGAVEGVSWCSFKNTLDEDEEAGAVQCGTGGRAPRMLMCSRAASLGELGTRTVTLIFNCS